MAINDKTDYQIQILGYKALFKELGVTGFIRFMQHFNQGNGDYTIDRDEWQQDYTIDSITEAVKKRRAAKQQTLNPIYREK